MPVFTSSIEVTADYPTIKPSLNLNFARSRALDPRITFTRASVGTYVGRDGLVKTAGEDEPRFDHDPETLESLGLLIEDTRTNILGLSSDLTDNNGVDWDAVNGTIAVNQTTAPDGTTTAASFTASAGNAEHSVVFAELVPTGDVTASIWVKTNTYSIVSFVLYGEANSLVSYNISTATVYNQASNVSRATIKEYPNGWYRISATMNCTVAASRAFRLFASTGNFDASGTESFYYWGPQVETGSFETSYIPTVTSNTAVTRERDDATIVGESFNSFYNQNEGSLFVESTPRYLASGINHRVCVITGDSDFTISSAPGGINVDYAGTTLRTELFSGSPNSAQAGTGLTVSAGNKNKLAYGLETNNVSVIVNGTQVGTTDTSASMPDPMTKMGIGRRPDTSSTYADGIHVSSIQYYTKRFTNAQLQLLTS